MNKAIKALFNIQKKLYDEGDFFTKKGKNLHFKSKYLQLPDLLQKVVPLLHAEDCMLLQGARHSDNPDIAIMVTKIIHSGGDEYVNEIDLPVAKLNPQAMGQAVTYGRRYGLESLFGIPTKDDDGEGAMNRGSDKKKETKPVASHFLTVAKECGVVGITEEEVKKILAKDGVTTQDELKAYTKKKAVAYVKANI